MDRIGSSVTIEPTGCVPCLPHRREVLVGWAFRSSTSDGVPSTATAGRCAYDASPYAALAPGSASRSVVRQVGLCSEVASGT